MNIPRSEYPRPELVRADNWLNLNGQWQFAFDFGNSGRERRLWDADDAVYTHEITVPFAPESKLSGIEYVDFIAACWYRRTVVLPAAWKRETGRILLHFGAVDYRSEVYVNGKKAGYHVGGYTPFTFDVTEYVIPGENRIAVFAEDNGRDPLQPTGKQVYYSYYNSGCSYTRSTGIWQTVWMEYVPQSYIARLKITPCIDGGEVSFGNVKLETPPYVDVTVTLEGKPSSVEAVTAKASFGGREVASAAGKVCGKYASLRLYIPDPVLWNVGEPNLYDLTVTAGEDTVTSYFGMRDVRVNGYAVEINHVPVYQRLVLDQGYYPDGIYTAPTDEALRRDVELSMAAGFNGARLHMKIFEPRLLYHADRLGYLLWGEFPNWGMDESNPASLLSILPEWICELERDYNHPSVIGWCPFNETGVRRNHEIFKVVYEATRQIDPMRPIIDSSGYVHVLTDIYDVHDYTQDPAELYRHHEALWKDGGPIWQNFPKDDAPYAGQPYFVSEFGGTYWNIDENSDPAWGYGKAPETMEEFYTRFEGLTHVLLDNPKMCAYCYTQLTDVFQEKNGIYAFDRRQKFDLERLHRIQSHKAAIEK